MQNTTPSNRTLGLMNSLKKLLCLIGLAAAMTVATARPHPINPPCDQLEGRFVFTLFQFDTPTTAHGEAEVWMGGVLAGSASAQYFNIEQKGNGVTHMNGIHRLTFLDGSTLVTYDEIRLHPDKNNPGWARANSRLYIVEGTGAFAGATGLLVTHGLANLFTLEGSIEFKGQVCLP